MIIRKAVPEDIPEIQYVRNSVKENILSDPNLVTDKDCNDFIMKRGKGWICEIDLKIVGFSIVDLQENNVWALFLHPDFENKGIGRKLHDIMLNWYFNETNKTLWLGTSPNTRAEIFYRKSGWQQIGKHGKNELKFEMTFENWKNRIKK